MRILILLLFLVTCLSTEAEAHNPLTARFELNATAPELTLLHVYVSQTGLHQALLKHYPDTNFTTISTPAYKQLAVAYVKEHVSLRTNETDLTLGEGGIKLGSHQTDFKFLVTRYPAQVEALRVRIDAFGENDHHQSVFRWKRGAESSKVVLSAENEYTGMLSASGEDGWHTDTFLPPSLAWLALGLGGVAVGSLLLVAWRASCSATNVSA